MLKIDNLLEGLDGRLSNADLVTTVVKSFQYEGIPLTLHEDSPPLPNHFPLFDRYLKYGYSFFKFLQYQALGCSGSHHSIFPRYKIESVTIRGIRNSDNPSVSIIHIERY